MTQDTRPLALVTGASSGIGRELARLFAHDGHDLVIAADRPLAEVARELEAMGAAVVALEVDLATIDGVKAVSDAIGSRAVAALAANAGHGLGHAFLDQDLDAALHVAQTNVIGTTRLAHVVATGMRSRKAGRILFTGSTAGLLPGALAAVYNASKAYVNSFAEALRYELKDEGVSVTVLMPGPVDTEFMARANFLDTAGGQGPKADPADVAKAGYDAMLAGTDHIIPGVANRVMAAAMSVLPSPAAAAIHARMAAPGSGKDGAA